MFVVLVLASFGALCAFGTAIAVERFTDMGRGTTAAVGAAAWTLGSGMRLTLVLVRWAAPSPTWPTGAMIG
jgi:hypothetical protein